MDQEAMNGAADGPSSSTVGHFVSLTGCPENQAEFFLEATNGNFDQAVEMYYDQAPPVQPVAPDYQSGSHEQDPTSLPTQHASSSQSRELQQRSVIGIIMQLPRSALSSGLGLLLGVMGLGAAAVAYLGSRVLPAPLLASIRGAFQTIVRGTPDVDPQESAEAFQRKFTAQYGESRPHWLDCGWQAATTQAHSQFKFLFVYLHAPHHQDADKFCRETLCNQELVEYVNSTFVCWGGDISYPDPYRLTHSLRVTGYPYVALLAFSGSRTQLIAAVEGPTPAARLLAVLQQAVNDHGGHLAVEQADANEREFNRQLREEQDQAYQQSLKEDQERERQRALQREQQAAAQRAAEEAAARAKAQQEAEAKRIADRVALLAARRAKNRAALKPEPAAGAADTTTLRVRLPSGSNHLRKFLSSTPLQEVWDWVGSLDEVEAVHFCLASSFPRQVFVGPAVSKSLSELGLAPQAALLVQMDADD